MTTMFFGMVNWEGTTIKEQMLTVNLHRQRVDEPEIGRSAFCRLKTEFLETKKKKKQANMKKMKKMKKAAKTPKRPKIKIQIVRGSPMRLTDQGWVVFESSTIRTPEGHSYRKCSSSTRLNDIAKVNRANRQNYVNGFTEAQQELEPGDDVADVCRRIEERRNMPTHTLNPDRVLRYWHEAKQAGLPSLPPRSRGVQLKDPEMQSAIFATMANWIRVAQVKYQNPQPTVQEVKLKLQEAFQSVGLPAQSLPHLFAKFRNNQPEVCHVSTSSNAKDHLRLSWVTRANLEEWHIGYVAIVVLCFVASA